MESRLLHLLHKEIDLLTLVPGYSLEDSPYNPPLPPQTHPEYHRRLLRVKVCQLLYTKKLAGFRKTLAHVEEIMQAKKRKRIRSKYQVAACMVIGIGFSFPSHGVGPTVAGMFGAVLKTQIAECEATETDASALVARLEDIISRTEQKLEELKSLPQNLNLNLTEAIEEETDL